MAVLVYSPEENVKPANKKQKWTKNLKKAHCAFFHFLR
ncbi:hypothetical protein ELI_1873 [Eubacterium callanderi]|uniref:Uncharacterized protein n=1 Tax=Eubacterium callanderi TaxID=53442 RepID=E3GMB6_9FIRM|nr:hypothetical protein ELI_1873 [Eubacterium callanderi]